MPATLLVPADPAVHRHPRLIEVGKVALPDARLRRRCDALTFHTAAVGVASFASPSRRLRVRLLSNCRSDTRRDDTRPEIMRSRQRGCRKASFRPLARRRETPDSGQGVPRNDGVRGSIRGLQNGAECGQMCLAAACRRCRPLMDVVGCRHESVRGLLDQA